MIARKYLTQEQLEELAANLSDVDEPSDVLNHFGESDEDISDNESEHSLHNSESEVELSNDEEEIVEEEISSDPEEVNQTGNYYYGKNRYKWAKNPPKRDVRTPAHNLVTHLPGLKGPARLRNPSTPYEAWQVLFTHEILDEHRL